MSTKVMRGSGMDHMRGIMGHVKRYSVGNNGVVAGRREKGGGGKVVVRKREGMGGGMGKMRM